MSILEIRTYGDPVLTSPTREVEELDGRVAALAESEAPAAETPPPGTRNSDTQVTGTHPTELPKSETNDAG